MNSLCSFDIFKHKMKNNLLDIVYKKYSNSNIQNDKYGFILNHINYDLEYLLNNFEYTTEHYFYTFDNMIYLSFNMNNVFENLNYFKNLFPEYFIQKDIDNLYFPVININTILNLFDYPLELKEAFVKSIYDILNYNVKELQFIPDTICMNCKDIINYCTILTNDNLNNFNYENVKNEIKNQLNELLKNI